jgi:hypothetical protein
LIKEKRRRIAEELIDPDKSLAGLNTHGKLHDGMLYDKKLAGQQLLSGIYSTCRSATTYSREFIQLAVAGRWLLSIHVDLLPLAARLVLVPPLDCT